MAAYRIRRATLDDVDVLVHHRTRMFADMGVSMDAAAVEQAFGRWLASSIASGVFRLEADRPGVRSVRLQADRPAIEAPATVRLTASAKATVVRRSFTRRRKPDTTTVAGLAQCVGFR